MKNRKNKKGFTIVELVIVVGVIGILSAILIPTFTNLTNQARDNAKKVEIQYAYDAYAIDVADGTLGGEAPAGTKVTKVYTQAETAIREKGDSEAKFYTYDNGWNTSKVAKTIGTASGNVTKLGDYNNYEVYYIVA